MQSQIVRLKIGGVAVDMIAASGIALVSAAETAVTVFAKTAEMFTRAAVLVAEMYLTELGLGARTGAAVAGAAVGPSVAGEIAIA